MAGQFTFSQAPVLKKRRSRFDLSHRHSTTMSTGYLYPILVEEVLPGDTLKVDLSTVIQCSSSFLKPVIDNLYAEVHFFNCPNRLVSEWEKIMGENKSSAWAPSSPTVAPVINASTNSFSTAVKIEEGDVGERLGVPIGAQAGFSAIPFRAFAKIYDDWFRDQNVIDPMNIRTGASVAAATSGEKLNHNAWSANNYTGKLPHVKRMADYFSTALPAPQKGDPIAFGGGRISGGATSSGAAFPVYPIYGVDSSALIAASKRAPHYHLFSSDLSLGGLSGPVVPSGDLTDGLYDFGLLRTSTSGNTLFPWASARETFSSPGPGIAIQYDLGADLSQAQILPTDMNEFVYALSLQRMLIKDAIGGTRYVEQLLSHWGVVAPDQRLQRTEYLGGRRFPISISQVAQTVPTADNGLGNLGAYSLSNGGARMFKGFVEHGYVIGVMFIRQVHSYSQGIARHWLRKNRVDFYDPCFANIGQQPIWKQELFANYSDGMNDVSITDDSQVFGYKEPWAEYKYGRNQITGQLRPDAETSLDIWTFTDDYANAPSLNAAFVEEDPTFVDRALAVPSASQDQFVVDMWFNELAYRVMPVYSKYGSV